ncbi:MAG: HDOD domain-containing protein [Gammaproteobacteria bacterium]
MILPEVAPSRPHPEISRLIEETRDLVSPPQVHFALLEVLNNPDSTTQEMADVISVDPALTARLLRIVNSPYYGMSRRIDTISRAVAIVGTNELFNLAVAVSATTVFARLPSALVNMDTFWRHSVFTAMLARELAKLCSVLHPERLFVAGILHDVGSLLLYNERPDTMSELLMSAQGDEEVLYQAERHRLGFSHAEVGASILRLWQLPETLCQAVEHHHEPMECEEGGNEACLVYLADHFANRTQRGGFSQASHSEQGVDSEVLATTGLELEKITRATAVAEEKFERSVGLFLP